MVEATKGVPGVVGAVVVVVVAARETPGEAMAAAVVLVRVRVSLVPPVRVFQWSCRRVVDGVRLCHLASYQFESETLGRPPRLREHSVLHWRRHRRHHLPPMPACPWTRRKKKKWRRTGEPGRPRWWTYLHPTLRCETTQDRCYCCHLRHCSFATNKRPRATGRPMAGR